MPKATAAPWLKPYKAALEETNSTLILGMAASIARLINNPRDVCISIVNSIYKRLAVMHNSESGSAILPCNAFTKLIWQYHDESSPSKSFIDA
jgi:hypothetical protein